MIIKNVNFRRMKRKNERGLQVINYLEIKLREIGNELKIKTVMADFPLKKQDLKKIASSFRRIASAKEGIRGGLTNDIVLVVSRSKNKKKNILFLNNKKFLTDEDSIDFYIVRKLVGEKRLLYDPKKDRFSIIRGNDLEKRTIRKLEREERILYSIPKNAPQQELLNDKIIVRPTLPIGFTNSFATLPDFCSYYNAIGGINGGYFANFNEEFTSNTVMNDPVGLLVMNGVVKSPPSFKRGSFIITKDNISIDIISMENVMIYLPGIAPICGKSVPFCFQNFILNETSKSDEFLVYTRSFGSHSPKDSERTNYVIVGDSIVEVNHGGSSIPQNGFIISMKSKETVKKINSKLKNGENKVFMKSFYQNKEILEGISAGPILIKDKKVIPDNYFDLNIEKFKKGEYVPTRMPHDVSISTAPRSALCITKDRLILLNVDDDRRYDLPSDLRYSVGATLKELADILLEIGCTHALNLDGGGSSTLCFLGKIKNRPSDGFPRLISTAVLVLPFT